MDGFHNVELPLWLTQYLNGGPTFNTVIATSKSGYEFRKPGLQIPIYRYKAVNCPLNRIEYEQLVSFFNSRQGRVFAFKLRDYFDYLANDQVIGIGDNTTKTYQLVKAYSDSSHGFIRTITLPVKGTVELMINKKPIEANIDYNTGKVELKAPLQKGEILSANFEFNIKVRFDNDCLNFRIAEEGHIILDEANFIEVI